MASLRERLSRFAADDDAAVRGVEPLVDIAEALLGLSGPASGPDGAQMPGSTGVPRGSEESDLLALKLAGLLHWARHLADGPEAVQADPGSDDAGPGEATDGDLAAPPDAPDLGSALVMLHPVWRAGGRLPEPLAEFLETEDEELAASTAPADRWIVASVNLDGALRTAADVDPAVRDRALSAVVELCRRGAEATPIGHRERPQLLANLAFARQRRFERAGDPADLDAAVAALREAVAEVDAAAAPQSPGGAGSGSAIRVVPRASLGVALRWRSDSSGDPGELDDAIRLLESSRDAVQPGSATWASWTASLSVARRRRAERRRLPDDAVAAVALAYEALGATDGGSPALATRLSATAAALLCRFDLTSDAALVDEAVELTRRAVESAPPGSAGAASARADLGEALWTRAGQLGATGDVDEAIGLFRAASTIAGDRDLPGTLTTLSRALHRRAGRSDGPELLDEALRAAERAVAVTRADDPARSFRLATVGRVLTTLGERDRDQSVLDRAVRRCREAVAPWRDDQLGGYDLGAEDAGRDGVSCLNELGNALLARYERGRAPGDLDEAILVGAAVVEVLSDDDPRAPVGQANLGVAHRLRYEMGQQPDDLTAAISASRSAATATAMAPVVQVRAAARWGAWSAERDDWAAASAGFTRAVELIALAAGPDLDRSDAEFELTRLGGLATDAAACALRDGAPQQAAALLEMGRGVLLGRALDARSDLTALREGDRALGSELERLRLALEDSGPSRPRPARPERARIAGASPERSWEAEPEADVGAPADARAARRRAGADLRAALVRVRQLPGLERFLMPSPADLRLAARQGPVVFVNVSRFGSAAIICSPDAVSAVPLPGLTPAALRDQVETFLVAQGGAIDRNRSRDARRRDEATLARVLDWLGEVVVGPVLARLAHDASLDPPADGCAGLGSASTGHDGLDPATRLWWCPTGLLALLPLHAAGDALDALVSSYVPTVRALLHSRGLAAAAPSGGRRLVTLAMPQTPGQPDLPGSRDDVAAATAFLGEPEIALTGPAAGRAAVLAALAECTHFHAACHAWVPQDDPGAACLLVAEGAADPVRLLDVNRLRLTEARLAFLAACATARTSVGLADEAIQLASAFQLAGFVEVVGTLWPVADRITTEVANAVYAGTSAGRPGARALHDATRRLRRLYPRHPSVWAAYVHAGV